MGKRKKPISFTLGQEDIDSLQMLCEASGTTNKSDILRALIPTQAEVEAALEIASWTTEKIRAELQPLGSLADYEVSVVVGFRQAFFDFLVRAMKKDIGLQLNTVTILLKGRHKDIVDLFINWIRAKRGVKGYEFKKFYIKVSERDPETRETKRKKLSMPFKAVIGPQINPVKVKKTMQQMYDLYEANPGKFYNAPTYWSDIARQKMSSKKIPPPCETGD